MAKVRWTWTCTVCRYANVRLAHSCEKCWIGSQRISIRFAAELGDAPPPPLEEEEEVSDSGEDASDGESVATTESTSSAESVSSAASASSEEAEVEPVLRVGMGRSKFMTATASFARPSRPRSKAVRAVARALWMAEEARARKEVGMAEA